MKLIQGSETVPVIYTAHHASHDFGEFSDRAALTAEHKFRFSDYGTAETVPTNGLLSIIAERSRALGDLNRDPNDPGGFQDADYGKPDRHPIWQKGRELTDDEKELCRAEYYRPFHQAIVDRLKARRDLTFVIAWDNTAHYEIGSDEEGKPVVMKPFILSNRGTEGSSAGDSKESVSCDPDFLKILSERFAEELKAHGLPNEVHLNLVYRGGYITRNYSTLRNPDLLRGLGINTEVQSLQLEYDTSITHDQETLEPKPESINALRSAFSLAIESTFKEYTPELN